MADEAKTTSWWQTLPGVLTALAGLITAATGAIIAINQFKGAAPAVATPAAVSSPSAFPSAPAPSAAASPSGPPDALKGELHDTIRDMRLGNPDYRRMDPAVAALVRDRLPVFRSRTDALGQIQKISLDGEQNGAYAYHVKFANGSMTWRIKFDNAGKIALLAWSFDQGGAAAKRAPNGG